METNWEQHYQTGHTPWDKGAAAPPLLDWMQQNPGQPMGPILVPGCGLGHDVRALAKQLPGVEVIGLDLSPTCLELAEPFPRAGLESYRLGDLFNLPQDMHGAFSCVWEHTCFCAIHPSRRDSYVGAVHQTLSSRGTLLAVFYCDPYDDEHQPGDSPPHGTTLQELRERFVNTGFFEEKEGYLPTTVFPGREGREWFMRLEKTN